MLIEQLKLYILENPSQAGIYLIVAKIVGAMLFFPGAPLTLLAGATLGTFKGSIVSIIGNSLGAIFAFYISRYLLQDMVQSKLLIKYPKINDYDKKLSSNGLVTVIILRLIPLFPFNALNYVLGVTRVKTKDYILGTVIGIIPGTIAFVYFGEALVMLSIVHITLAIIIIVVLIYIGKYYDKKYNK